VFLSGVRDSVVDQRQQVIIGDAVDDTLAFSSTSDQSGRMQDLQPSRNGRHLLAFRGGNSDTLNSFPARSISVLSRDVSDKASNMAAAPSNCRSSGLPDKLSLNIP
jgi:hypothetical protein